MNQWKLSFKTLLMQIFSWNEPFIDVCIWIFRAAECCVHCEWSLTRQEVFLCLCTLFIEEHWLLMLSVCRYDVELFQRIETLIGKKLPAFPTQEEEVMMLVERVSEAQRFARIVRPGSVCVCDEVTAVWRSVSDGCVSGRRWRKAQKRGSGPERRRMMTANSRVAWGRRSRAARSEEREAEVAAPREEDEHQSLVWITSVVSPCKSNKCCILFSILSELSL